MTSDHVQQRLVLLLTDVHDAAQAGDWQTVRQKTEQVLRLNPFNHDARAYWALAKNGGLSPVDSLETEVEKHLATLKAARTAEAWQAAGREAELILEIDPGNAEAQGYLRAAEEVMSSLKTRRGGRKPAAKAISASLPATEARVAARLLTATSRTTASARLQRLPSPLCPSSTLWPAAFTSGGERRCKGQKRAIVRGRRAKLR